VEQHGIKGYEAQHGSPLSADLPLTHPAQMLSTVAPIMLLLEGGYNLSQTAKCTEHCMRVLLGEDPPPLPLDLQASDRGREAIIEALEAQAPYWQAAQDKLAALSVAWQL